MALQLAVRIDRESSVPLYHQLAEQLAEAIDGGVLKPGDAFENELSLASRLDLSRPTVRRAITELVGRGLLVRRRGIGTTVAREVVHRRNELTSLFDDLAAAGHHPVTEVLQFRCDEVNALAAAVLGLPEGTELVYLERLVRIESGPVGLLRNWLHPRCADLDDLTANNIYQVLAARGLVAKVAHQTIGARPASAIERRALGMGRQGTVLTLSRRTYDAAGAAVEFGDHSYRADTHSFEFTVYAG